MIKICESYAIEYDIIFNPDKSKVMCFNNGNYIDFSIQLFNHRIEIVDSYTHLGTYVSTKIEDRNVQKLLQQFYMRTNYMLADFNMLNSDVLKQLHNSYCMNFYGSELLNLNKSYMLKIYTAWRKVMRRIYRLNNRTHNYIINNIACTVNILLHKKTARFIHSLLNSSNSYMSSYLIY